MDDSELSFNSEVDQPVVSTPNRYSEATAPPAVTIEEVRTSDDDRGILRAELVRRLRKKSCSRRNFAAKLVEVLFDKDIRKTSNVAGKWGKRKLNPILIQYIKSLSFQHFPLEEGETQNTEWARCVVAIDEKNRRLNKGSRDPLDLL